MVSVLKRGECDERTCVFTLEVVKFGRKIANANSENDQQLRGRIRFAYFFQPAVLRALAYMRPIAPMPMRPIVGWLSEWASGETWGFGTDRAIQCRSTRASEWRSQLIH